MPSAVRRGSASATGACSSAEMPNRSPLSGCPQSAFVSTGASGIASTGVDSATTSSAGRVSRCLDDLGRVGRSLGHRDLDDRRLHGGRRFLDRRSTPPTPHRYRRAGARAGSRPWPRNASGRPRPAGARRTWPSRPRRTRRAPGRARCAPRSRRRAPRSRARACPCDGSMRSSVSSRIRAISAFDHSRMAAMSSSACLRSSVASSDVLAWMLSMWAFASAENRSSVSARAASAATCMALVRSAMNLLGLRVGVAAAAASVVGTAPAASWRRRPRWTVVGRGVDHRRVSRSPARRLGLIHGGLRRPGMRQPCSSDSVRSVLHGSRKPVFASVVAMRGSSSG